MYNIILLTHSLYFTLSVLDEHLLFLHTALIASNVYCEVSNKFFRMN